MSLLGSVLQPEVSAANWLERNSLVVLKSSCCCVNSTNLAQWRPALQILGRICTTEGSWESGIV